MIPDADVVVHEVAQTALRDHDTYFLVVIDKEHGARLYCENLHLAHMPTLSAGVAEAGREVLKGMGHDT